MTIIITTLLTLPKLATAGYTISLRDKKEFTETEIGIRNVWGIWTSRKVRLYRIPLQGYKPLFNFGEEL